MTTKTPQAPSAAMRILRRQYHGSPYNTMLSQMQMQVKPQEAMLARENWTGRKVLGYKLPIWQRDSVWTDEQCKRFIESVWLGVGLGMYMVNMTERRKEADNVLLDGQQRLRAIERYWADELAIVGEDGNAYRWGELTDDEKAHFLRIPFAWTQTQYVTEAELRNAYNRHNFGGTAHAEHERA